MPLCCCSPGWPTAAGLHALACSADASKSWRPSVPRAPRRCQGGLQQQVCLHALVQQMPSEPGSRLCRKRLVR
eukprot:365418-Chlamydomonas_euryale.AAC.10